MKKLLALALAFLMLLGVCSALASCNGGKNPTVSTGEETTVPTEPETTKAPTEPQTTETPTEPVTTESETNAPETTEGETNEGETTEEETTEGATDAPETTEGETNAPETTEGATDAPETTEGETNAPETTEGATDAPETTEGATDAPETEPNLYPTLEEAIALGESMEHNKYTEIKYYVTGIVKKAVLNNLTITDDKGNELTVYGAYNEDGTVKYSAMTEKPAVGDTVTVYGIIGQNNKSARMKDGWIMSFTTPEAPETTEPETTAPETPVNPDTPAGPNIPGSNVSGDYATVYPNGEVINEAGIDWVPGFFANVDHSIDKSAAVPITAAELLAKMQDRDGESALKKGEVFIVTEPLKLQSSSKYYGNGASVIAEGGIIIKDAVDVVVKDVLIGGNITIENSAEVIFFKVFVDSDSIAVTLKDCSDISFKTCRFRADTAAISGSCDYATIYSSYTYAHNGIILEGNGNIIQNCKMFASDTAVSVRGEDCVVRENRIEVYALGTGIKVAGGSVNALVALNDIRNVQNSITVTQSFNCSVILNRIVTMTGKDNTNLYVIDNSVGGYLTLENNNYLIAEGNRYPFDGLNHIIKVSGNQNVNGNNVTDVNYRPQYGAYEDILPHTNKELFVTMPRKASVQDASMTTAQNLNSYVLEAAKNSSVVIVPPGAYSAYGAFRIDENHSNTKIYAYGVYNEYAELNPKSYISGHVTFALAKNVSLYGLTLGYALPSSGQVRVVEKFFTLPGDETKYHSEDELTDAQKSKTRTYKFTVIADPGFLDGFTTTDPDIFHTWWPETFLSDENGEQKFYTEENPKRSHSVVKNYDENGEYDGTMTFTINLPDKTDTDYKENKSAKAYYDRVSVGNVITCRLNYGGNSYSVNGCDNLEFRDTVIYGYAAALSVVTGNCAGVTFERHHNTTHSENVIDKATYEKYLALEEKWGVDFEIREQTLEDGTVIYRGPVSRTGSIDAFHIASNRQGVTVTASLLEGMCDDGSNQKGSSSRLHNIVNNGDGTTTIYYKALVSSVAWGNAHGQPNGSLSTMSCANFTAGNRIYIYTPDGRTVCDTTVLSDAARGEELTYDLKEGATHQIIKRFCYSVTVKTADIDWDAILDENGNIKYDLSDNSHYLTNRLCVDNLSHNSCDYTMDNVMVLNGHSRGFLIKSRDVTIKNCTFRNVANSGLRIMVEPEWGESSVAMNVLVQGCLFDNTGYHMMKYNDTTMANILIDGTSTKVSEDTLPLDNIKIIGNKFTNSKQRYAIYVNSAKNVTIKDNVFDDTTIQIPDSSGRLVTGLAVTLRTCMNVEISDNTYNYKHYDPNNIRTVISGYNFANITGTDVTNEDGTPKLPDNFTNN